MLVGWQAKVNPLAKQYLFFFCGVDPAPAEAHTSDDGAITVGCARPRRLPTKEDGLSENPADWYFDYVFARRITWREKASTRQWAGVIHDLHRRFRFERIVMDPNGGGTFVKRDLINDKQIINGIEVRVTPIADQEEGPFLVVRGDFILHMFRMKDPGVQVMWPEVGHSDNLNDAMYGQMKDDLEHMSVAWPPLIEDWLSSPKLKAEVLSWPEEKRWALINLSASTKQYNNVKVATKEDGTYAFTRHNARQFSAVGKKDFVTSGMLCRLGFLIWLRSDQWRVAIAPDDVARFGY